MERYALILRVWTSPVTTKSDYAREHADIIAALSSDGWITTEIVPGAKAYGRKWKVTAEGLIQLCSYCAAHPKEARSLWHTPNDQDQQEHHAE